MYSPSYFNHRTVTNEPIPQGSPIDELTPPNFGIALLMVSAGVLVYQNSPVLGGFFFFGGMASAYKAYMNNTKILPVAVGSI